MILTDGTPTELVERGVALIARAVVRAGPDAMAAYQHAALAEHLVVQIAGDVRQRLSLPEARRPK